MSAPTAGRLRGRGRAGRAPIPWWRGNTGVFFQVAVGERGDPQSGDVSSHLGRLVLRPPLGPAVFRSDRGLDDGLVEPEGLGEPCHLPKATKRIDPTTGIMHQYLVKPSEGDHEAHPRPSSTNLAPRRSKSNCAPTNHLSLGTL